MLASVWSFIHFFLLVMGNMEEKINPVCYTNIAELYVWFLTDTWKKEFIWFLCANMEQGMTETWATVNGFS